MTATREMATTRDVKAARKDVWDAIANGWTYAQWVVGNSRTRAVDSHWPEPGSAIKHSVGVWPFVISDQTTVESCTPGEELVLRAGIGALGAMRITLRLSDLPDGGCHIEMIETPASGPVRALPDRLVLAAVYPRNRECLWRLSALAERLEPSEVK